MIFLICIALLVNMDSIVYFFEIPYQLVEMGGTQEAVSILNVIHAVVYVVSSGISSGKITKDRHNKNLMLFLIICLSSVYAATCFAVSPGWICGFVAVHGLLIGVFWSAFWSAFYRVQAQAPIKISTLTILSALCSVIGPFVAGKLYIVFGKYVLLLFSGLLIIALVLNKPMNRMMYRPRKAGRKNMQKDSDQLYRIEPWAEPRDAMRISVVLWSGMVIAGYLEGVFRSAMAIYLMKYDIESDIWGIMQSVQLLSQTAAIILIRMVGEERVVFSKTKVKITIGMGSFAMGALLMVFTKSIPVMILSMILLGIGYGVVYFLCMCIGTRLTGLAGKNLNGIAECLTGLGILLASVVSGIHQGNPYYIFLCLTIAGITVTQTVYKKTIWKEGNSK